MEPLGRLGQVTAIRKEQSRSDTGMRGCTRVCVVPRRYVWLSPTSSGLQKSVCGDSDSPAASSFWEKRLQETTDRKGLDPCLKINLDLIFNSIGLSNAQISKARLHQSVNTSPRRCRSEP